MHATFKGIVKKYRRGAGEGGRGRRNNPEHLKMWWLKYTWPTPSIWHTTELPPLNKGCKLHDLPPIKHDIFGLQNSTKLHFVYEIMVLYAFRIYFLAIIQNHLKIMFSFTLETLSYARTL